jgi:hypothetical protein
MHIVEQQHEWSSLCPTRDERRCLIEHREPARGIRSFAEAANARCKIIIDLQGAENLHPRPVRGRRPDLRRAAPRDLRTTRSTARCKLSEQAALTDAGLAADDEHGALSDQRTRDGFVEND